MDAETKQEQEVKTQAEEAKPVPEVKPQEEAKPVPEVKPQAEEIKPRPTQRAERDSGRPDNTVYVGKKGVMGYVLAVVTQFNNGADTVTIKARGKVISHAVDVAEIVRNRFMPEVKLTDISIKTEELTSEDGSMAKVSAIEITLKK